MKYIATTLSAHTTFCGHDPLARFAISDLQETSITHIILEKLRMEVV